MVSMLKSRPAVWYLIKFAVVLSLVGGLVLLYSPLIASSLSRSGYQSRFAGAATHVKGAKPIKQALKKNALSSLKKKLSSLSELSALDRLSFLKSKFLPSTNDSALSMQVNTVSAAGTPSATTQPFGMALLGESVVAEGISSQREFKKLKNAKNEDDVLYGEEDEDDGNSPICHKLPFYPGDKCAFAKGNCYNPLAGGTLNYLQMRYCLFPSGFLFYIFMGVWVLFLFYFLGNTAESNFCPSLTAISDLFRLSPDVSGVTLLAFGNGAPDIASIMAGALTGSAGFVLGEPIGSGLFITTGIFAAVTLLSDVKVESFPFLRDIGTNFLGVLFCFIVYLTGRFELWHSLTCLGIYFLYVFIVIVGKHFFNFVRYMRRRLRKRAQGTERQSLLGLDSQPTYSGTHRGYWREGKAPLFDHETPRVALLDDAVVNYFRANQQLYGSQYFPKIGIVYKTSEHGKTQVIPPSKLKREASSDSSEDGEDLLNDVVKPQFASGSLVIEDHFAPLERIPSDDDDPDRRLWIVKQINEFLNWIEWREMSTKDKLFYILVSPTILIRNLTIPIANKEEWSKFFAVLNPIFIPWFLLWVVGYATEMIGPVPLGLILTGVGCIFSLLIFLTSNRRKAPIYHPLLVFVSFFMGIAWIYVTANELVAVLQSIGILFQLSDAILASTVLTWGNSLGDMVADVVVSRSGFPDMACSAIFGGPTMNLLIGVGLSVTYHCLSAGEGFTLEMDPTVLLTFTLVIVSLLGSAFVVPISGFTSPKLYGIVLLFLYFFFMGVAVAMELGVLFPFIK